MKHIVVATTIRQGNPDDRIESTRAKVFLDTAREFQLAGYSIVAVHVDCTPGYLSQLSAFGIQLIPQVGYTMGAVRREALSAAASSASDVEFVFWTEPEKPHCAAVLQTMSGSAAPPNKAVFFNRTTMSSYPPEQAHYYSFVRAVASSQLGFDFDYGFGPMLLHKTGLTPFLQYHGEYGDKWDSILIPRLRLICSQVPFALVPIDFLNDERLTRVEAGNHRMINKRLDQLNNVVPSLLSELTSLKGKVKC